VDLRIRSLQLRDIPACFEMLRDDTGYVAPVWESLPRLWQSLLVQDRMTGAVVEDCSNKIRPRIYAYGTALFITDAYAAEIKSLRSPMIRCHTARVIQDGRKIVLDRTGIRDANSTRGLNLLLWQFVAPSRLDDTISTLDRELAENKLVEAVFWMFQGFQLREIFIEVTGDYWKRFLVGSGFQLRSTGPVCSAGNPPVHDERQVHLLGLAREEEALGTRVAPAFTFAPPRMGFPPGEQALLLLALEGFHDQALAEALCLSPFTIKARWRSVYERVHERCPQLLPETAEGREAGRGAEKRRALLNYLRGHMEELRPYKAIGNRH
jgi:hypothetical protein